MTWKFKKTRNYDKEEMFTEWDKEILSLDQFELKGVITGEDPF